MRRWGLPRAEQRTAAGGEWKPYVPACACGKPEQNCPDANRHTLKAYRAACLSDPDWEDPAPFPVPQEG